MEKEIINRVEKSQLVQINLDEFYPQGERVTLSIAEFLTNDLVLREKPFRVAVTQKDWSIFTNKHVAILPNNDAIIPLWAYMLIASKLNFYAKQVVMGSLETLEIAIFNRVFEQHDFSQYQQKSVIIKGCGKYPIPETVFVDFAVKVQGFAKSILFGEACSSVPVFKNK